MLQYKKHTLLLLILPLFYINTVFAENDLIWDGASVKTSKYLFFSPSENGAKSVYQSNNRFSTGGRDFNSPDIKMVRMFGGCIVNSQALNIDLLSAEKCVDDFYISDSEITNAQYNKFLLATGKSAKAGSGQNPVVNVSWQEAIDFTKWLSAEHQKKYSLPSTTQWQYAANTDGTSTQQDICNQTNASACKGGAQFAQVKSLTPNQWGLYDMYGNVWEWVIDASKQEKTAKGGSWYSSNEIFDLNNRHTPDAKRSEDVGFRVVGIK